MTTAIDHPDLWLLQTQAGRDYAQFVAGLRTAVVEFETDSEHFDTENPQKIRAEAPLAAANSVGSLYLPHKTHKPVLDIDFPVMVVPSTTPGHNHLYIDYHMTWPNYMSLLRALGDSGIVQPGYVRASIARESSWVRTPWTRKGQTA